MSPPISGASDAPPRSEVASATTRRTLAAVTAFDVGIVGAGIHGASAAFHLAATGARAVIVERGTPAGGPTGRSSAVCRAYYTNRFLATCARDSIAMFERFEELTGTDPGHHRTGLLYLHQAADADAVRVSVRPAQRARHRNRSAGREDLAAAAPGFELSDIAHRRVRAARRVRRPPRRDGRPVPGGGTGRRRGPPRKNRDRPRHRSHRRHADARRRGTSRVRVDPARDGSLDPAPGVAGGGGPAAHGRTARGGDVPMGRAPSRPPPTGTWPAATTSVRRGRSSSWSAP